MSRIVLAALLLGLSGAPAAAINLCFGEVAVRCLRSLGHDFQDCGRLTDETGRDAVFENCGDLISRFCYPCVLGTWQETARACAVRYGPDCNRYRVEDPRFDAYR